MSTDSVIVIDQVEYEVDYRFAKRRVTLRYTPDMKNIFIVETDGWEIATTICSRYLVQVLHPILQSFPMKMWTGFWMN